MKNIFLLFLIAILLSACSSESNIYKNTQNYKPDDQELYNTIIRLDSIFFNAYNTCDSNLEKYSSFYAEDVEFYHDKSGLSNSKKEIVEGTKNNVCGKVTRELVKGSIEVYPINNYGAIEIGLHKFHNKLEPNNIPKPARFTIIWKKEGNDWKIKKVISLH